MQKKQYLEIINKIQSYCAYRDRCKEEVIQKLIGFDLSPSEYESIINDLEAESFFNEERYAISFVRGKFRIKKWGKHKIKAALMSKKIQSGQIKAALLEINDEEYIETLKELVEKKLIEINKKDSVNAKFKAARYAASKGYESDLIWDILNAK